MLPSAQSRPWGIAARAVALGLLALVVGCGDDADRREIQTADARSAVVREKAVREGMERELMRLEGERRVHLFRASVLVGEVKPPQLFDFKDSTIARAFPSWGIRRAVVLWRKNSQAVPWYNRAAGDLLRKEINERYDTLEENLRARMVFQDRRIAEAERYLQLVSSLER